MTNDHDAQPPLSRREAWEDIVLALLLAIGAGVVAAWFATAIFDWRAPPMMALLAIQGVLVLVGVAGLLIWRRQSWRSLGLPLPQPRDLPRALLALLFVFAANLVLTLAMQVAFPGVMEAHAENLQGVADTVAADYSLLAIFAVMLLVGFYEEILARGLLLQRCRVLIGGIWGPVLISSALFGLGHAYQGWVGVLQTAVIGIVLARLAIHWGTLWPLILAHAMLNTWSLGLVRTLQQAA